MVNPFRQELQRRQRGVAGTAGATNPFRSEIQRRQQEAEKPGALGFATRGAANVLGAPVDVVNLGLEAVGLPVSETPFGGSESIAGLIEGIGDEVAPAGAQPQTFGQSVARGAGEAVGGLLPFGAAARGAQLIGGPVARGVGQSVMQPFVRSPAAATAVETAAGAGAGAGGEIAAENFGEDSRVLGELAGGLGVGSVPALIRSGPTGWAARKAAGAVAPFTRAGGQVRAQRRVQEVLEGPEGELPAGTTRQQAALEGVRRTTEVDMDPVTRSGDEGLMALREAVLNEDASLRGQFKRNTRQAAESVRRNIEEMGEEGRPEDLRAYLEGRRNQLIGVLDTRVKQASDKARQRLSELTPQRQREEASLIVREETENALRDVSKTESRLWEAEPLRTAEVYTQPVFEAYLERTSNLPQAYQKHVPDELRRALDPQSNQKFGERVQLEELTALRSDLLEQARNARSGESPDRNKARILQGFADDILGALESPRGLNEEGRAALQQARNFSRIKNELFSRGSVGRMLGMGPTGGERVAPEMTLPATVGAGGQRGAVAGREIEQAVGAEQLARPGGPQGVESARGAVSDYLTDRLLSTAVRDGQLNTQSARKFLNDNRELMRDYPEVRQKINRAIESGDIADLRRERLGRDVEALRANRPISSAQEDAASRYIGAPVGEEIGRMLQAPRARETAAALLQQAQRDRSGQAVRGLKGAFTDYLVRQATDPSGEISGNALSRSLRQPRVSEALQGVFDEDEIGRLRRLGNELRNINRAQRQTRATDRVMADVPGQMLDLLARYIGAQQGQRIASGGMGSSLVMAEAFSGRAQQLLRRLTNDKAHQMIVDALTSEDSELLETLLGNINNPRDAQRVNRRLNAYLAGPGSRLIEEEVEEENQNGNQ